MTARAPLRKVRGRGRAHNGAGSISQEPNGTWKALVSLGKDPISGRRRRPTIRAKTYDELVDKIEQAEADYRAGMIESNGTP